MGRRLILDTHVLIAYEQGSLDRERFDDDLAVAAISIAEYRVGIELADTSTRAADRSRALAAIASVVAVLDYTETTATQHARLIAHIRRAETPRGTRDLIIGAHAAETGRTVVSRDASARFALLPGVTAMET